MWFVTTPRGLQRAIILGAALSLAGTAIRAVPCLFTDHYRHTHEAFSISFAHVGQMLNAATGPLLIATPTLVSATWFSERERTLATAIGVVANGVGAAVGFPLGPGVVNHLGLPALLYLELALAAVPVLAMIVFGFPAIPPTPPSPTALQHLITVERLSVEEAYARAGLLPPPGLKAEPRPQYFATFVRGVMRVLKLPALWLLVLAGGIQSGVNSAWGGVLPQILEPLGYKSYAGWMGFSSTAAATVGSLFVGRLADALPRRLKSIALGLLVAAFVTYGLFTLSLPSPFGDTPPMPSTTLSVFVLISLGGFFQAASEPLIFELLAEVTYPTPESTSGSLLTLMYNAASLVVLTLAPSLKVDVMNAIMTAAIVVAFVLILAVRSKYLRSEAEAGSKAPAAATVQAV